MASQWFIKVSGAFKEVNEAFVKVSGNWKEIQEGYIKVSGAWKKFYQAFVATSFTQQTSTTTVAVPSGANAIHIQAAVGGGSGGVVGAEYDKAGGESAGAGGAHLNLFLDLKAFLKSIRVHLLVDKYFKQPTIDLT